VEAVLASLKLPIDERGRRRAEARAQWLASADTPLELHEIVVG
ncbi:MAG: ATPase, partial [Xanthobacteraceae bacterium]